ncbi:MAG: GNAT family N-acetyltransferase [Clostridiales bacterium]|jgi:ribosomal protein S18 acetylase RimI-like enzyme|nr:GNAT family N-acetyltransferase [Clostridiales bacterium]
MLDKSIAYRNIIMKIGHEKISEIAPPILPEGYSFRFFKAGDEAHWARIETSVLEFESEDKALEYFRGMYLPHREKLEKRLIFALNPDGLPIATANSWFTEDEEGYKAALHWVSVCPEYQGLGIGKTITKQALLNFRELEPNRDIWLHTQTWSHVAVRLYSDLGFHIMKAGKLGTRESDFKEAIEILRTVMPKDFIDKILSEAI